MRLTLFNIIFIFYNLAFGQSQKIYNFSGTVIDSNSGDFIPYAYIFDTLNGQVTESDNFGRFAFNLKPGIYKFYISVVGYNSKEMQISIQSDHREDIFLSNITLSEVIIHGRSSIHFENNFIDISPEKLRSIPSLLGERDVLKALTILPGVSAGFEGTNQFAVRGGSNDQNLILLDGSVLYNTSHLFGFLSAIEPHSIKSFRFYKDGFPVAYGGRLSSVVDISLKEGNYKTVERFINVGIVTSSYGINGPLIKNKLSYLVSIRTAYPGLFTLPFRNSYKQGNSNSFTSYFMYDVISKLSLNINSKNSLYLSVYSGKDYLLSGNKENGYITDWNINWGNSIAAFRYHSIISKRINFQFNTNYNKYQYKSALSGTKIVSNTKTKIENQSDIQDIKSSAQFNYKIINGLNITLGGSRTLSNVKPKFQFTDQLSDTLNSSLKYKSSETSLYSNIKMEPSPELKIDLGIRFSNYSFKDYNFKTLQPRALLSYQFLKRKLDFYASFSKMYQPLHLILNQANGYINDVWIAANELLPPQQMQEFSVGVHSNNSAGDFRIALFFRKFENLSEVKDNIKLLKFSNSDWESLLEVDGKGKANGLELSYSKGFKKINLLSSYTHTNSKRWFSNINQGKAFPSPLERKHVASVNFDYIISEKKTLSTTITYFSGSPITLPAYSTFTGLDLGLVFDYVYTERYNARLPAYKRIDLAYKKIYISKKGRPKEWTFSIYNLLFNRNITQIIPFNRGIPSPDDPANSIGFKNEFVGKSFLLFIPGINFYYKIR